MAGESIKTSELFQDDGTLKRVTEQITLLTAELVKLETVKKKQIATATKLQQTAKKANVTQKKGREEISKNAKEVEEMSKRYKTLTGSMSKNQQKLEGLKQEQARMNTIRKNQAKLLAAEKGSYNALSAQYSIVKMKLNEMSGAQRKNTKEGKAAVKQSKKLMDKMKGLQEETGKNTLSVGDYGGALKGMGGPLGAIITQLGLFRAGLIAQQRSLAASTKGLGFASAALKIFKFALIATGVGALVVLLGTLVAFFLKTQKGVDMVTKVMDKLGAAVNVVRDRLSSFGEGLAEIAKGNFAVGAALIKKSMKGIGEEIKNEVQLAAELADQYAALIKKEVQFEGERAESRKKQAKFRLEAKKLQEIDAAKANEFVEKAMALQEENFAREIVLQIERVRIAQARSDMAKNLTEDDAELVAAKVKLAKFEEEGIKRQTKLISQQNDLLLKMKTQAKTLGGLTEKQKEFKAAQDALKETQIAYTASVEAYKTMIAGPVINALKGFSDELEKLNRLQGMGIDTSERRTQIAKQIADVHKSAAKDLAKAMAETDKEAEDRITEMDKRSVAISKSRLTAELLRIQSAINNKTKSEKEGNSEILAANLAHSRRMLKIAGLTAEQRLAIEKQLAVDLKAVAAAATEAATEAAAAAAAANAPPTDIYELLGLTLDDEKKQQFNQAIGIVKDTLGQIMDARAEAAGRQVAIENKRVSSLEQALAAEQRNKDLGLVSDIGRAKKELEAGQKLQERALKEQEKAQKQRRLLQTLEQTANMITASTKIWAELPWFLAIPALAFMWGSFAASKIKAAKIAKQNFREGGLEILKGGTHASGNDTSLGFITNDGKEARGERGEAHAIIPAKQTRKYRKTLPEIVEALRKGTFEKKFQKINAGHSSDSTILIQPSESKINIDLSNMESSLEAIRQNGERLILTDKDGNITMERYKNRTKIYV